MRCRTISEFHFLINITSTFKMALICKVLFKMAASEKAAAILDFIWNLRISITFEIFIIIQQMIPFFSIKLNIGNWLKSFFLTFHHFLNGFFQKNVYARYILYNELFVVFCEWNIKAHIVGHVLGPYMHCLHKTLHKPSHLFCYYGPFWKSKSSPKLFHGHDLVLGHFQDGRLRYKDKIRK